MAKKPIRVTVNRPDPPTRPLDPDLIAAGQAEGLAPAFLGFAAGISDQRLNGLVAALTHPSSDGQVDVNGGDEAAWRRAFPWLHHYSEDEVRVLIRWAAGKAEAVVVEDAP